MSETEVKQRAKRKASYHAVCEVHDQNVEKTYTIVIHANNMKELNAEINKAESLGEISIIGIIKGSVIPHRISKKIELA